MMRVLPFVKTAMVVLALIFCLSACHSNPDAKDSQGNAIYLSDYQGKWLIVNYWATWCKPCLVELPELSALHNQLPDKLVVLGVSFDHLSNAEIQQFAAPLKLNFPLLSEFPISKFGIDNIPSLPVTFIIDPRGQLAETLYGPQTKQSLLTAIGSH